MSILGAADLTKIAAEIQQVIGDNSTSLVLRRSDTTLSAQTVRVERTRSRSTRLQSPGGEEQRTNIIIIGDTSLDIQKDDRFTYGGNLYRVRFVRPNVQVSTQAEAEMIQ